MNLGTTGRAGPIWNFAHRFFFSFPLSLLLVPGFFLEILSSVFSGLLPSLSVFMYFPLVLRSL